MKQELDFDLLKDHQAAMCASLFMVEHNQLKARVQILAKASMKLVRAMENDDDIVINTDVDVALSELYAALTEAGIKE